MEADLRSQLGEDIAHRSPAVCEETGGKSGRIGGGDGGAIHHPGVSAVLDDGSAGSDEIDVGTAVGVRGELAPAVAGGDGNDFGISGGIIRGGGRLVPRSGKGYDTRGGRLLEDIVQDGTGIGTRETEVDDVGAALERSHDSLGEFERRRFTARTVNVDGEDPYGLAGLGGRRLA